jgi:hypothetical protein
MLWFIGSIAAVKCAGFFPKSQSKAEEAVSPAPESIDLVGLEQTELVAPYEIGPGRGYKVKGKRLSSGTTL